MNPGPESESNGFSPVPWHPHTHPEPVRCAAGGNLNPVAAGTFQDPAGRCCSPLGACLLQGTRGHGGHRHIECSSSEHTHSQKEHRALLCSLHPSRLVTLLRSYHLPIKMTYTEPPTALSPQRRTFHGCGACTAEGMSRTWARLRQISAFLSTSSSSTTGSTCPRVLYPCPLLNKSLVRE